MSMRIGLITTLNTNIGDDFIRTGVMRVLRAVYPGREIDFRLVNKHEPATVYPEYHPIRLALLARRLPVLKYKTRVALETLFATPSLSRFEDCDLIAQCGAPVIWENCHTCEWARPIWRQVVGRLYRRIPVLNLAAGSAYSWERPPSAITNAADAQFLRTIHGYCKLTTARDDLTKTLFESLGCATPQIPCSALLAAEPDARGKGDLILINYMPGGGHYDLDQHVDANAWRTAMQTVIGNLRQRHNVAFLCHNAREHRVAQELVPGLPCFLPKSVPEYFEMAAQAKAGIFNRMHAAVALAGMGVPSIAIGTDTRLFMVQRLGLPSLYVKEATAELLEETVERLLRERATEQERLLALREETFQSYQQHVHAALAA